MFHSPHWKVSAYSPSGTPSLDSYVPILNVPSAAVNACERVGFSLSASESRTQRIASISTGSPSTRTLPTTGYVGIRSGPESPQPTQNPAAATIMNCPKMNRIMDRYPEEHAAQAAGLRREG